LTAELDVEFKQQIEDALRIAEYKLFTSFSIFQGPEKEDPYYGKVVIRYEEFDQRLCMGYGRLGEFNQSFFLFQLQDFFKDLCRENDRDLRLRMNINENNRKAYEAMLLEVERENNINISQLVGQLVPTDVFKFDEKIFQDLEALKLDYVVRAIIYAEVCGCFIDVGKTYMGSIRELFYQPPLSKIIFYLVCPSAGYLAAEFLRHYNPYGEKMSNYIIDLIRS